MRTRAAVLEQFGQPLVVQEVELEEPRAGEALVRLVACGVCHTDLYTASGADPSGYAPAVLGHEGAGCRLQDAERIVCVDLSEERLALARGQGATDTVVGGPDAVDRVLELVGGLGADYTFEATGNVRVMRQAVESARMGWGLATVC